MCRDERGHRSDIVTENSQLAPASDEARISDNSAAHALASAQVLSQVAVTLAARLLMTANSVIAGIIVARWLGAEGLGQLAVINVAVATVVQLASLGLPSANTYFIAQDNRQLRAVAINSIVFALLGGSLLAVALTLLAVISA